MRTVNALRYSVVPVVRNFILRMTLGTLSSKWALLESESPLFLMTVRSEFDDYCLRRTIEAGAEFRVVKSLLAVTQESSAVHLDTSEGTFHSRFLIGADGANSQVRRMCGFAPPRPRGFAIEACVEASHDAAGIRFDFGAIANGYGWSFPKGNHVNVGLCKYSMDVPFGRNALARYAESAVGTASLEGVIGQYVDCTTLDPAPVCGRVLLAGDAGGFADALTGEGIYHAIASGQAASRAILQYFPEAIHVQRGYAHELRLLHMDLSFCRELAPVFYSHLDFGRAALSLPQIRQVLTRTYASGESLSATMSSILYPLLQLWRS
jgi:flavin-dependent dehydrogenase